MNKIKNQLVFLTFLVGLLVLSCMRINILSKGLGFLFPHDISSTFDVACVQTLMLSEAKLIDKIFVTGLISYKIVEIAF